MKIRTLTTGSRGNVSILEVGDQIYAIDMGVSYTRFKKMSGFSAIDGLILTHTHSDHLYPTFLEQYEKRTGHALPVYQGNYELGRLSIEAIRVPHDVPNNAYVLTDHETGEKAVYATDMANTKALRNNPVTWHADYYFIEGNYDINKLEDVPDVQYGYNVAGGFARHTSIQEAYQYFDGVKAEHSTLTLLHGSSRFS